MSRRLTKHSPLSLLLTILAASLLGSLSVLVDRAPVSAPSPFVEAEIHAPRATHECEGLDLLVRVTNRGPGDALAPLDGVLSLQVFDLGGVSGRPLPVSFVASAEVSAAATGPLTLAPRTSAETRIRLTGLSPLDRAGSYRLQGELYGPSGVLPVGPLDVVILPPPAQADLGATCPTPAG